MMTSPRDLPDEGTMSFGDHLEDLRRRILMAVVPAVPLSIGLWFFKDTLIKYLVLPLRRVLERNGLPAELQTLSPPEMLVVELKLCLIFSAVILAPWILWQLWQFIRPGLYQHERRFVRFLIPGSAVLTVAGVCLLYFLMLPLMLQVLVTVGSNLDLGQAPPELDARVEPLLELSGTIPNRTRVPTNPAPDSLWVLWPEQELQAAVAGADGRIEIITVPRASRAAIRQSYRVSTYISFVLVLLLGITIAFQMPLVIMLLGWLGLVTPQWLIAGRRYALLACAVLAAVITPPDAVSMIAMLIPLYLLYELGILLLRLAPASKVAEGGVLQRWWPGSGARPRKGDPDKQVAPPGQAVEPAQPEATVPRTPEGTTRKDDQDVDAADEEAGPG